MPPLVRKLHCIGQQIVDNLAETERVADVSTLQFGSNIAMQLQAFGRSQRFKTDMNLFQQAGGMEGDPVYLRLMKVEPVEIEQIDHQLQQMFR